MTAAGPTLPPTPTPLQSALQGLLDALPVAGWPLGLAVVAAGVVVAVAIHHVMQWAGRLAAGSRFRFDGVLVRVLSRPLAIVVVLVSVVLGLRQVEGTADWLARWPGVEAGLLVVAATWVVAGLVREVVEVYGRPKVQATETDFDDRLLGLADLAATLVVWTVGLLLTLSVLGIRITPLLASMGVAGLAVALALRTILGNFFGGLVVTADRTVQPGHRVRVGKWVGDVEAIGRYKTTLRTRDNLLVSIPNDELVSETVVNFNLPESRTRVEMEVGVAYGTDIDRAEAVLRDVVQDVDAVVEDPPPEVTVKELGESAVVLRVLAWQGRPGGRRSTRDEVYRAALERFGEEGIEVPYPQVDVGFRDDLPEAGPR